MSPRWRLSPAPLRAALALALALVALVAAWAPWERGAGSPGQTAPSAPTPPAQPRGGSGGPSPGSRAELLIRVRYPDGATVPWGRVEVWEGPPSAPGSQRLLNATNEDSTFSIDLPRGRAYGVRAWGDGDPGYLGLREVRLLGNTAIDFEDPSPPPAGSRGNATLAVHVRYGDGTVVAWGRVEVWDGVPGGPGSRCLLNASDVDSSFSTPLPTPRRYYIRAWDSGGYLGMVGLDLASDRTVTIVDPSNPYPLSPRVEVMYYAWYGNPATDGRWIHWDEAGRHPPDDIASAFYPALGPYSSADLATLEQHMAWIREAGAGVLVYSWWGPKDITDQRLPLVLDQAARFGLRVALHMEPGAYYTSPAAALDAAATLEARFASHPAFLPRFHIFLATEFPLEEWRSALAVRHPGILLAQTTNATWMEVFDGLYQYDGSANLSTAPWAPLASLARSLGKIFMPNVAPGYDETRAAGGRAYLTVDRGNGTRYDRLWTAALAAGAEYVAVTSFNEWHEGTQIEPAVPRAIPGYARGDYGGLGPLYYITRTLAWTKALLAHQGAPPGGAGGPAGSGPEG